MFAVKSPALERKTELERWEIMSKPDERIAELEQQVKRITNAQGAQFTTLLTAMKDLEDHANANVVRINARFDRIEKRFDHIEEALTSMKNVLETVSALLYKKFGDHPDTNFERHGE